MEQISLIKEVETCKYLVKVDENGKNDEQTENAAGNGAETSDDVECNRC